MSQFLQIHYIETEVLLKITLKTEFSKIIKDNRIVKIKGCITASFLVYISRIFFAFAIRSFVGGFMSESS